MDLKFIKLLAPLLLGSFLVMPSYAVTVKNTFLWDTSLSNASAAISYNYNYEVIDKLFTAEIGHSKKGEQKLYFSNSYLTVVNICKNETTTAENTTMIFDGQAVKMFRWCDKSPYSGLTYYTYTSETDRGNAYIVNLFKIATLPIKIQYDNEILYFPVIGFTKAWNSAGGNAI